MIDEAGHGTEPETIIPLVWSWNSHLTRIVLAGDPRQLGPVVHDKRALQHGLGVSLLERLMSMPPYVPDGIDEDGDPEDIQYNPQFVVKLVRNYRSHPALLTVSSRLFYSNQLVPSAPRDIAQLFVGLAHLPNPDVPLVFHAVEGRQQRDGNSLSWFNLEEVEAVLKWVQNVLYDSQRNAPGYAAQSMRIVMPQDISIITPYAKQANKLRKALQKRSLGKIEVGTVELFQGRENSVIIISTVRSQRDKQKKKTEEGDEAAAEAASAAAATAGADADGMLAFARYGVKPGRALGFVGDPRRFNVSVTRAKSLMIVVGNPFYLQSDPSWQALLEHCREQGCCMGASWESEAVAMERQLSALQRLQVDENVLGAGDGGADAGEGGEGGVEEVAGN